MDQEALVRLIERVESVLARIERILILAASWDEEE